MAGVVYDAMLDELFSAEAGGGAYLNGEKIVCVENADIENVLIGAGLPVPGQSKGGHAGPLLCGPAKTDV